MVWPRVWQAGPVVLWQPPRSVLPSPAGLAGLAQKDGLFFFFFIPSSSKDAQLFQTPDLCCV